MVTIPPIPNINNNPNSSGGNNKSQMKSLLSALTSMNKQMYALNKNFLSNANRSNQQTITILRALGKNNSILSALQKSLGTGKTNQQQKPPSQPPTGGIMGSLFGGSGGGKGFLGFSAKAFAGFKALTVSYEAIKEGLKVADKLQLQALRVGTNISNVAASLKGVADDLPISQVQALEIKLGLVNEGIRYNNKEVFNLAAQMKMTGQNEKILFSLMRDSIGTYRMTNKQVSELSDTISKTSVKYNIGIDKLIGSLDDLGDALEPFDVAGMAGPAAQAFTQLLSEAGPAGDKAMRKALKSLTSEQGELAAMRLAPAAFARFQTSTDPKIIHDATIEIMKALGRELDVVGGRTSQGTTFRMRRNALASLGLTPYEQVRGALRSMQLQQETLGMIGYEENKAKSFYQSIQRLKGWTGQNVGLGAMQLMNMGGNGVPNATNQLNSLNMNQINGMRSYDNLRNTSEYTKKSSDTLDKIYKSMVGNNNLPQGSNK